MHSPAVSAKPLRAVVQRQHGLGQAELHQPPHLCEAPHRRLSRIGGTARVRRRCEIAPRQAAIIVRGSDKAIEIDLESAHVRTPIIGSSSFTGPGAISVAIGQAESSAA
mgnify:CR=1 FL=1